MSTPHGRQTRRRAPFYKRVWFWILAVIAVIVVASDNGEDSSSSEGDPAPAPESPAAADDAEHDDESDDVEHVEEDDEIASPGLGQTISIDGWDLTVTSVENGLASVRTDLLTTDAQGVFALINSSITNTANEGQTILSNSFIVLDEQLRQFEPDVMAPIYLNETGIAFTQVNPGNTATGILVLDLPADVPAVSLEFTPGILGGDSATISLQ